MFYVSLTGVIVGSILIGVGLTMLRLDDSIGAAYAAVALGSFTSIINCVGLRRLATG